MPPQDQNASGLPPGIPPPPPGFVPLDDSQSGSSPLSPGIPPPPAGFVPVKEAPPELQTTGLSLPNNVAIRAAQPSVWDRIKSVFTEGIPQFSSRTVHDPKYGEQQFITPEAAMTPLEQQRHPVVTGASGGVGLAGACRRKGC